MLLLEDFFENCNSQQLILFGRSSQTMINFISALQKDIQEEHKKTSDEELIVFRVNAVLNNKENAILASLIKTLGIVTDLNAAH